MYFIAETDIEMNARGSKFEQLISDQIKFYMVIDFITVFDIRRQLGKQFLGIQRDVGFLIPTENTLRNVGEKELDIPSRITPGFIGPMLEMAQEQYGPDSKLVLANDERKVILEYNYNYYKHYLGYAVSFRVRSHHYLHQ